MSSIVTRESPSRYFVAGAESDSEEFDYELAESTKTIENVEKLFYGKNPPQIHLIVKFKNPIEFRCAATKVHISASQYLFDKTNETLSCTFISQIDNPVFLSLNHQGRYSKTSIVLTGEDNNSIILEEYPSYIPTKNDSEYQICSEDLHFRAKIALPSEEQASRLQNKVQRSLFHEAPALPWVEESNINVIESYRQDGKTKVGAIFCLEQAFVKIKLHYLQDL